MVSFFETWLYERDQTFFTDQITILVLKKFSIDANMIDEMLLRALANGSGSDLEHLHIGRVIFQHPHFWFLLLADASSCLQKHLSSYLIRGQTALSRYNISLYRHWHTYSTTLLEIFSSTERLRYKPPSKYKHAIKSFNIVSQIKVV